MILQLDYHTAIIAIHQGVSSVMSSSMPQNKGKPMVKVGQLTEQRHFPQQNDIGVQYQPQIILLSCPFILVKMVTVPFMLMLLIK